MPVARRCVRCSSYCYNLTFIEGYSTQYQAAKFFQLKTLVLLRSLHFWYGNSKLLNSSNFTCWRAVCLSQLIVALGFFLDLAGNLTSPKITKATRRRTLVSKIHPEIQLYNFRTHLGILDLQNYKH